MMDSSSSRRDSRTATCELTERRDSVETLIASNAEIKGTWGGLARGGPPGKGRGAESLVHEGGGGGRMAPAPPARKRIHASVRKEAHMRRLAWLPCLALAAGVPALAQERPAPAIRIATYNAYLLSPIFKCLHINF